MNTEHRTAGRARPVAWTGGWGAGGERAAPALFADRRDAGRRLAERLRALAPFHRPLVLALPRGGVPVAYEVAEALGAPLDVLLIRKLGVPGHEELAMGAIASGGVRVMNSAIVRQLGIGPETIERVVRAEQIELDRRARSYRGSRPLPTLRERTVVLVDDGLATGASMMAAIAALRQQGAESIIAAVPVGSREACAAVQAQADACICVTMPDPFYGVGQWYEDFGQTSDDEVRALLATAELDEGRRADWDSR
jgi:predicted phosphoribosyltransferase